MNAPEGSRYFAFVSYSHRDERWAAWLHKALETYRVPNRLVGQTTAAGVIPRRLAPIFRDRDELASATDLSRQVNDALAHSKNLIVICSPHAAQSRWVDAEVLAFKRLGNAERIFCLIVDGEPNASEVPGRTGDECFTPALRFELGADGRPGPERTEPIAADARAGKDGKANANLKLIAGMLDVGFDALKQRELQRRNRRLAIVTAAALLIMAITTSLAITAVIARHDAERRQKQAEELVNFMLGDLNDKLTEVHRLDILQAVDDKAMAYFASLPTRDVTDEALAQRVTALQKIGAVRSEQGQIPASLDAYNAASVLAAEVAKRAPGDPARQTAYADSLKWVGQAHWYGGDLDDALVKFRAAAEILEKILTVSPGDNELAFKLAAAKNNIGHVLEARGDFPGTKIEYEATKSIYEQLRARDPTNPRWKSRVGDAYNNLGKLALEQGEIAESVAAYRSDQRIKAELAATDPGNHDAQENLLVSNAILGRTLALCGNLEAAKPALSESVNAAKALMAFDPTDVDWQEYFALYSQQLGSVLRQQRDFAAAASADADAERVLQALVAKDPTRADWQLELAQGQLESARLELSRGRLDEADAAAKRALDAMAAQQRKDGASRNAILAAAQSNLVSGQIAEARHDSSAARAWWTQARDKIALASRSEGDPNFLVVWATALLLLDELNAARPIVARLSSMGYRTSDFEALLRVKKIDYEPNADVARRVAQSLE